MPRARGPAPDAPYAAVAETHSSVVVFLGDRAYKVRKPEDLGFLDFRTREARELDCRREVELNRRLAPDVYEGVADVVGPDGRLCDHVVVMRRLPASRRLSTLVEADEDVMPALRSVAHQVATLHAASVRSELADRLAGAAAMRDRWEAETAGLRPYVGSVFEEHDVDLVRSLALRYLDGRDHLFEQRVAQGKAVDGHGDLLADDVFCLDDGPRILDCLQFDEQLRLGDGLADVAFLAMDLERLGRPDLADAFLAAYAELRPDRWPSSLAHHHVAHRAQVRALVTAIRVGQGDEEARPLARRLLQLAADHLESGRVRLVVVGGAPGTGKSTVAAGLGVASGAVVLRSDEVRKELAGVRWDDRRAALYDEARTAATYETMLARARDALRLGESVVLDATWTSARARDGARRLAQETASDLLELRCDLPPDVAADRIRRRQAQGDDVSDATPAVAAALAAGADPWPEAEVVHTSGSPDHTVAKVVALLRSR
jgi:aminoglycoside phosphotransferase family enzyme/predicted kinase